MVDAQPLQGIRYDSQRIENVAELITPPYDVISEEDQARYYQRNPYNVIRLELGRDETGDTSLNNRYTRAATMLAEWRRVHILCAQPTTRHYFYLRHVCHA